MFKSKCIQCVSHQNTIQDIDDSLMKSILELNKKN